MLMNALPKIRHELLDAPVDALHVHRIDAVELGLGHVQHGLVPVRRARVVDDGLHAAEVVDGRIEERLPVGAFRHVALNGDRAPVLHFRRRRQRDLARHALRRRPVQIVDDDVRALARKGLRDAFAETRTAARHDHRLALQSHRRLPLSVSAMFDGNGFQRREAV
jgi:hypothetical protein